MTLYMRDRQNREEGFEEGREKQRVDIIINALKKGRSVADIADFMNCSPEEIQEIEEEFLSIPAK